MMLEKSLWILATRILPKSAILNPLACASLLMRIQMMARWPMWKIPLAHEMNSWMRRSTTLSKSSWKLRPATSTRIASGYALPSSISSISGPMTSTFSSSTSFMGFMRNNSNASVYLLPNSTYMSSLRTRSPSKPAPYGTGTGIFSILMVNPRTSAARVMMSGSGTLATTCSYTQIPVGRISGMFTSEITGNPKLIAPAAVAYFSSVITWSSGTPSSSCNASTKARTRSWL